MTARLPAALQWIARPLPAKSFPARPRRFASCCRCRTTSREHFNNWSIVTGIWCLAGFFRCLGDRQLAEDLTQENLPAPLP